MTKKKIVEKYFDGRIKKPQRHQEMYPSTYIRNGISNMLMLWPSVTITTTTSCEAGDTGNIGNNQIETNSYYINTISNPTDMLLGILGNIS